MIQVEVTMCKWDNGSSNAVNVRSNGKNGMIERFDIEVRTGG
jgi:hypothetical protein